MHFRNYIRGHRRRVKRLWEKVKDKKKQIEQLHDEIYALQLDVEAEEKLIVEDRVFAVVLAALPAALKPEKDRTTAEKRALSAAAYDSEPRGEIQRKAKNLLLYLLAEGERKLPEIRWVNTGTAAKELFTKMHSPSDPPLNIPRLGDTFGANHHLPDLRTEVVQQGVIDLLRSVGKLELWDLGPFGWRARFSCAFGSSEVVNHDLAGVLADLCRWNTTYIRKEDPKCAYAWAGFLARTSEPTDTPSSYSETT